MPECDNYILGESTPKYREYFCLGHFLTFHGDSNRDH